MGLLVSMGTCRLALCIESVLIGVKGRVRFGGGDAFCCLAVRKHAGPYLERSGFPSLWDLVVIAGSPPWCELGCAAFPKANRKAEKFFRSTYALELWFVLLRWRYRKEKFLIVHLKTGNS